MRSLLIDAMPLMATSSSKPPTMASTSTAGQRTSSEGIGAPADAQILAKLTAASEATGIVDGFVYNLDLQDTRLW